MNLTKIAWRSIQHRSLASGLTAFSMSLGVALIVTVLMIYGVLDQSFRRSAQGYDLIVGPKGSSLELVISTVFYQREPLGKIPYEYYTELRSGRYRSVVEAAIPIALGEHYQGHTVVGTTSDFFSRLEYYDGKRMRNYQFLAGENFSDHKDYDAVVGYSVAKKTKLEVGKTFRTQHGKKEGGHEHDNEYTVVGILKPTGTPNDKAIFINIEGFYDMHAGQDSVFDESLRLKQPASVSKPKAEEKPDDHAHDDHDHAHDDHDDHAHDDHDHANDDHSHDNHDHAHDDHDHGDEDGHDHDHHKRPKELTAVFVLTKETATEAQISENIFGQQEVKLDSSLTRQVIDDAVVALPRRIDADLDAQAVSPVEVIASLFENVIGNVQIVLLILATLVVIVAGIGMMVSIYNSMNERRQEIAIMRALGAKRTTVMAIILLESILLSLGGGLLGMFFGHTLMFILGPWITEATGIIVSAWSFQWTELLLIPGLVILASIVGYLPAVIAYRTDVAQSLQG